MYKVSKRTNRAIFLVYKIYSFGMFSLLSPSWFHLRFLVLQFTIADSSRSQEYSHSTIRLHDQKNSLFVQPKSVNVLVSVSWHCFQWGIISVNRGQYSLSSWRFFHALKRPAVEPLIKRSTRSRERFWTKSLFITVLLVFL